MEVWQAVLLLYCTVVSTIMVIVWIVRRTI